MGLSVMHDSLSVIKTWDEKTLDRKGRSYRRNNCPKGPYSDSFGRAGRRTKS